MSEQLEHRAVLSGGNARPEPADENVRWLTGWLDEPEALQALSAGRYGLGPYPVGLQEQARAARAAVAVRPPFEPQLAVLPHVEGDPVLAVVSARADIHATFAGASWQPRYIDLGKVIALQKLIVTDNLDARIAGAAADSGELLELCLPSQPQPIPVEISPDADGHAVTVSSLSPNLRIQGIQVNFGPIAGSVTFVVGSGSPYLTVVELGDRLFLRDGHHRAVALLAAGIKAVPAIMVTGRSYADVATVPGLFGPEVTLGDRPPLVTDFFDDRVCAAAIRRPLRKVARISASEFPIAR